MFCEVGVVQQCTEAQAGVVNDGLIQLCSATILFTLFIRPSKETLVSADLLPDRRNCILPLQWCP